MSKTRIGLFVCLLQIATFSQPTIGASPIVVTIAYQGPLTGGEAATGSGQFDAVSYAVAKFNAASSAYQVKVIPVDDQGDPAIAATVAPAVAKNKQIIGLVGPAYSGATIVSLPYYRSGGLTLISPTASRVTLTDPSSPDFGGPIFHRIALPDASLGLALASKATAGVTNAKVFIFDDQSSYSVPLASYVMAGLKKIGVAANLVGTGSEPDTTTDYSALLAKIKASGANVVIFTGYFNQAAIFVKQLRNSGSKAIFAAGDGVFFPDYIKLAGGAAEGTRLASTLSDSLKTFFPKLETDFKKTLGRSSGLFSVEAIDATNIFLQCISEGNITRITVLRCVKSFKGVTLTGDEISFSNNGDVVGKTPFQYEVIKSAFTATNVTTNYYEPEFTVKPVKPVEPVEPAGSSVGSSIKKEILCSRGTITRKLRSANPVCPPGYSQKGSN